MKKTILVMLLVLLGMMNTACSDKKPVAIVNGKEIIISDFEKTVATYKESIEKLYGENVWDQEIKKSILTQMVQEELMYEEAKKDDLEAKEEVIEAKLKELKVGIEKDKDYAEFLKSNGIDDEFLKSQLKKEISIQNYKDKFYENTEIDEKDIKKYYEENKDEYKEEKIKVSHILISTIDENTNKPISEPNKKEAKKKAEEVYKKAKEGQDFANLAKEYSQDDYSAVNGGDLGFFERGKMVPEFETAAFNLDEGQISQIIETQYGYHIIKLTDKKYTQYSFEEVKDKIEEVLLYQKYMDKVKELEEKSDIEKNEKEAMKIKI